MIRQNLVRIKERIQQSCAKVRSSPQEITLVAVTKGRGSEQLQEVAQAGIYDIGENKVQEALTKYIYPVREYPVACHGVVPYSTNTGSNTPCEFSNGIYLQAISLSLASIRWHMIGHLQTNKVKDAVRIFDLIQSVDSLCLAEAISKEAGKINKQQDILLEVKTSPEKSKFGMEPEDTLAVFQKISQLPHLKIKGLMTIAPFTNNPETSRPYFRTLKELLGKIDRGPGTGDWRPIVSMGMSDDFEVAIEEGATMIRLGRAVFQG